MPIKSVKWKIRLLCKKKKVLDRHTRARARKWIQRTYVFMIFSFNLSSRIGLIKQSVFRVHLSNKWNNFNFELKYCLWCRGKKRIVCLYVRFSHCDSAIVFELTQYVPVERNKTTIIQLIWSVGISSGCLSGSGRVIYHTDMQTITNNLQHVIKVNLKYLCAHLL